MRCMPESLWTIMGGIKGLDAMFVWSYKCTPHNIKWI